MNNRFEFLDEKELNSFLMEEPMRKGGESVVYYYKGKYAIKIFDSKQIEKKENKIKNLMKLKDNKDMKNIVFPKEIVYVKNKFAGYVMPFIKDSYELEKISEFVLEKNIKLSERIGMLKKVCDNIEIIHNNNIIIGDLHPGQIITNYEDVFFIDVDSWGGEIFHEYFEPSLKCISIYADPICRNYSNIGSSVKFYNKSTDYYSLAIIAFKVLTGIHPFSSSIKKVEYEEIENRMLNRKSILSEKEFRESNSFLNKEVRREFLKIFEEDYRFNIKIIFDYL